MTATKPITEVEPGDRLVRYAVSNSYHIVERATTMSNGMVELFCTLVAPEWTSPKGACRRVYDAGVEVELMEGE